MKRIFTLSFVLVAVFGFGQSLRADDYVPDANGERKPAETVSHRPMATPILPNAMCDCDPNAAETNCGPLNDRVTGMSSNSPATSGFGH